jgi:hypothetical protein
MALGPRMFYKCVDIKVLLLRICAAWDETTNVVYCIVFGRGILGEFTCKVYIVTLYSFPCLRVLFVAEHYWMCCAALCVCNAIVVERTHEWLFKFDDAFSAYFIFTLSKE